MRFGRGRSIRTLPPDVRAAVISTVLVCCTLAALGVLAALRTDPVLASRTRPVAVFMGDSYVSGAGATDLDNRFGLLIAQAMGWEEINMGRGGTGYVNTTEGESAAIACGLVVCPNYSDMIPEVVAARPDVVVVTGGRNDLDRMTDPAWAQKVANFYLELRRELPAAKIIAVSPIWDDRAVPAEIQTMRTVVRQNVIKSGGVYVDLGDPLLARPDLVASDNHVLPNDKGHMAIALAFKTVYNAIAGGQVSPSGSASPSPSR